MAGQIPPKGPIGQRKLTFSKKAINKAPDTTVLGRELANLDLTAAQAKSLTDKIRKAGNHTIELIIEALTKRIWLSMRDGEGNPYKNWNDYAQREFGGPIRVSVSRHDRPELVAQLHKAGASQTIIAGITGTTQQTVSNDIKWVESQRVESEQPTNNLSADPPSPLDVDVVPLPPNGETSVESATIIGADNKERPRKTSQVEPNKTKDPDILITANRIATRIEKLNEAIDDLFRTSGARESVEVKGILRNALDKLINAGEVYGLSALSDPEPR